MRKILINKKIMLILNLIFITLLLPVISFATEDVKTTQISINGVQADFEYNLNSLNQVENLKCKNTADLIGDFTIPSTIDGYIVISLGNSAFSGAKNITGVTIPESIKEVKYKAFEGCSNLENVNLGSIEIIEFEAFKNCPKLTKITIPKTLTTGPVTSAVFTGTTNINEMIFEDGLVKIPAGIARECKNLTNVKIPNTVQIINEYAFASSGLTSVSLPSSVKKVSYKVFNGCSNLENVNLGSIEEIGFETFNDCPKLTKITIPKTLTTGPVTSGVFTGTTNINEMIFEDGLVKIPAGIARDCKNLTNVKIPNTVQIINEYAFAGSGLKEIEIPNSVTKIEYYSFKDCSNLEKITIYDKAVDLGWYNTQKNNDTIFVNHNNNLTIYCYRNSKIAQYAIDTNIKYIYIDKENNNQNNSNTEDKKDNDLDKKDNDVDKDLDKKNNISNNKKDNTTAPGSIPYAGKLCLAPIAIILLIFLVYSFIGFRKLKDVK